MEFLTLFSPPAKSVSNPERQAALAQVTEELFEAGVLIACGDVMNCGIASDSLEADDAATTTQLTADSGYAVFRVDSREELQRYTERFLEIASDGHSEIIEIEPPVNH